MDNTGDFVTRPAAMQAIQGRSAGSFPEGTAELVDFALSISTNKKSACLYRAGCINFLSCSSKEVVRYEE